MQRILYLGGDFAGAASGSVDELRTHAAYAAAAADADDDYNDDDGSTTADAAGLSHRMDRTLVVSRRLDGLQGPHVVEP